MVVTHTDKSARQCNACDKELVVIQLSIDGNDLIMESCETCDVRRWQLAGEVIDRQTAIAELGDRAGRRR